MTMFSAFELLERTVKFRNENDGPFSEICFLFGHHAQFSYFAIRQESIYSTYVYIPYHAAAYTCWILGLKRRTEKISRIQIYLMSVYVLFLQSTRTHWISLGHSTCEFHGEKIVCSRNKSAVQHKCCASFIHLPRPCNSGWWKICTTTSPRIYFMHPSYIFSCFCTRMPSRRC